MNRGFTLLETILYLALFAILMGGIASSFFLLFQSADRSKTTAMLLEEKAYLVGKIQWALSGAQTVSAPAVGAPGSSLSVLKYDSTGTGINLTGGNMLWNGAILNNSNVTISNLVFLHTYSGGSNPESIEAGFTLSTKTGSGIMISQKASTTRYLRK